MHIKKWLLYSFISILILLTLNTLVMYWSDTYSVAHPQREEFYTEPNTKVLKVEYILANKKKYDSFIFGSSRVGNINPFNIKNGTYYNMTYSEGIPKEHLLNIKLFLNEGITIKNLLIGLDDFSYQVSFNTHQTQGLTKLHPMASEISWLKFYKDYFFRFPTSEDRNHIKTKLKTSSDFSKINIKQDPKIYLDDLLHKNDMDYNTSKHLHKKEFDKPTYYSGNTLESTLEDIKNIKQVCQSHQINCIFFINPMHKTTYDFSNIPLLKKFKQELAKITDYYDFAYPHPINNNNFYWHETSHYRSIVGDIMIHDFEKKGGESFGIYHPKI